MYSPTIRLFAVLELLQSYGQMSGTEIAGRDWVEAASCTWLHEALLLVSVLEAACIPAARQGSTLRFKAPRLAS